MALQWLRGLSGISPGKNSTYDILRLHPQSIRAVYGISTVLFKLLQHVGMDCFVDDKAGYCEMNDSMQGTVSGDAERSESCYDSDREKEALTNLFNYMTPCGTYGKRYLLRVTMGISEEDYDREHIEEEAEASSSHHQGNSQDVDEDHVSGGEEYQEDECEDGVLLFDNE